MKSMATTLCGPGIRLMARWARRPSSRPLAALLMLAVGCWLRARGEGRRAAWLTLGSALAGALAAYPAAAMLLTLRSTLASCKPPSTSPQRATCATPCRSAARTKALSWARAWSAWCAATPRSCPRCAAMLSWWPVGDRLAGASRELSDRTEQRAAAVEQTSASVNELVSAIQRNAADARGVEQRADEARQTPSAAPTWPTRRWP